MNIKALLFSVAGIVVVVGLLAGTKALQIGSLIKHGQAARIPPEVVTAIQAQPQTWESLVTAVGSLEAVQGVTVTAELTGKVTAIAFEPGTRIKAGELLVQQDIAAETAQLRSAEAAVALARITWSGQGKCWRPRWSPRPTMITPTPSSNRPWPRPTTSGRPSPRRPSAPRSAVGSASAWSISARSSKRGRRSFLSRPRPDLRQFSRSPAAVAADARRPCGPDHLRRSARGAGGRRRRSPPSIPRSMPPAAISGCRPRWPTRGRTAAARDVRQCGGGSAEKNQVLTIPATAVLYAPYSDSVFIVEEAKAEGGGAGGQVVRQQFVRLGESAAISWPW
jgi:membrane fusion protein, multidrug efflux system